MKKLFILSITLLATVVSCTVKQESEPASDKTVNLVVKSEESRSYLTDNQGSPSILWGKGEFLRLYYDDGKTNFADSDAATKDANDGKSCGSFSFTGISCEDAAQYSLGAVYPACAVATVSNKSADSYKVILPSIQNATATSYDPAAYIMVAKTETFDKMPSEWTASFYRAVSLNQLVLAGVGESVKAVEISAEGKALCGGRFFDLTMGTANEVYSGSSKITVKYANAVPAGYVDVFFTSWDAEFAPGEELSVKVVGTSNSYTKTITAGASGIKFSENKYCSLTIDFSDVEPDDEPGTIDFIRAFAGELDVWAATTGAIVPYTNAGYSEVGNIIPADYSFFVGTTEYTKADALYVASKLLQDLSSYSLAEAELVSPVGSIWSESPYMESPGNGGEFTAPTVNFAFVKDNCSRQVKYHNEHGKTFSNFCGSSGHIEAFRGKGDCCLERYNLMLARVFKYIIDNDIKSGFSTALSKVNFDAGLYEPQLIAVTPTSFSGCAYSGDSKTVTVDADAAWTATLPQGCDWITLSPANGAEGKGQTVQITVAANSGDARSASIVFKTSARSKITVSIAQDGVPSEATIQDFAEAYVGLLDVWSANRGNIASSDMTRTASLTDVNYIPFDTEITVLGKKYNISQALEIAMRSYMLLMGFDGNSTTKKGAGAFPAVTPAKMSDNMPGNHNYSRGYWYNDTQGNYGPLRYKGQANVLYSDMLENYSERNVNFGSTWANTASYNAKQFANYTGTMIPGRAQLAYIRVFKMILDNKVTENINTFLEGKPIDSTCYNNANYD